ncbi:MAG: hypothetical protein LBD93_08185 [Treponema sp.]|nr:hypothetical protein [Treponema sp.]
MSEMVHGHRGIGIHPGVVIGETTVSGSFLSGLPYADSMVWAYYRILKEHPEIKLITSAWIE